MLGMTTYTKLDEPESTTGLSLSEICSSVCSLISPVEDLRELSEDFEVMVSRGKFREKDR
jgi:hypothetical protein